MRRILLTGLFVGLLSAVGVDARAGAGAQETDIGGKAKDTGKDVLGTVTGQTSHQEIISKLDDFEDKLKDLEKQATNADENVREDLMGDIKDMREKVADTRERAQKLSAPDVQGNKAQELRGDIQDAFSSLSKDYQKAHDRLSKGGSKGM